LNLIIKIVAAHITMNMNTSLQRVLRMTETDDSATLCTVRQVTHTRNIIVLFTVWQVTHTSEKSELCNQWQVTQYCMSVHLKTDNTAPLH